MDVKAKALDTVNTSLSIDISSLDIKQELEKQNLLQKRQKL